MLEELRNLACQGKQAEIGGQDRHHPVRALDRRVQARFDRTQRTAKKQSQITTVRIGEAAARLAAVEFPALLAAVNAHAAKAMGTGHKEMG
jgi:hypothetical protein